MHDPWVFVAFLLPIGLLLPAAAVLIGIILGPRKPNAIKGTTYEDGVESTAAAI